MLVPGEIVEPLDDSVFDGSDLVQGSQNPVAEFLDTNYDLVLNAEVAWQRLNSYLARQTNKETIDAVMDTIVAQDDINRHEKRQLSGDKNHVRKGINFTLAEAKWNAQYLLFGPEDDRESAAATLEELYQAAEDITNPYQRFFLDMVHQATSNFYEAFKANQQLLDPLFEMMAADAGQIEDLLSFLEDEERDLEDYEPFLRALATNHFDPCQESVISASLELLRQNPEADQDRLLAATSEATSQTAQVMALLGQFALSHQMDPQTATEFMNQVDFEQLPTSVKNELLETLASTVNKMESRFSQILAPYRQPRRFFFMNKPDVDGSSPNGQSKTKRKGGKDKSRTKSTRVTNQSSTNTVFVGEAPERQRRISEVRFAKNAGNAYTITPPCTAISRKQSPQDWRATAVDRLMQEKPFAKYASTYQNHNDIALMLESILADPIDNGVSFMKRQTARIIVPGQKVNKVKRILHFSPKDSTGIEFSQSAQSNRTRIFYFLDGDAIVFLDIQHKTTAERQEGTFRKN